MKNRRMIPTFVYVALLFLLMNWVSNGFGMGVTKLTHTQINDLFVKEQVKSFIIQGNKIELTLHTPYEDEDVILCNLGDPDLFLAQNEALLAEQMESGILEGVFGVKIHRWDSPEGPRYSFSRKEM